MLDKYPREEDLGRAISDLERRLIALERGNQLSQSTISAGGLTVKDTGSFSIEDGLGNILFSKDNGPMKLAVIQASAVGQTFTQTFQAYIIRNVVVPINFTFATVIMSATSQGGIATSSGELVTYVSIEVPTVTNGPSVSSKGSLNEIPSPTAALAAKVPVTFGTPLVLKVFDVIANPGSVIADSCNAHLSALIIFTRA